MFRRFASSWSLVKASAAVLQADKQLIVFPIVSAIGTLLVTLSFALPMFFAGVFDAIAGGRANALGLIVGFLFYLCQYFVIFFSNSALVGAAMIRLQGGTPTLSDGFRIASQRAGTIFGYALVAATVGVVLRSLSERLGIIGRVIVSLIGFAWNVATFLVVPVLVVEDVGPVDAIKRSSALLRQTWGEQLIGNAGVGVVFGLFAVGITLSGIALTIVALAANLVALAILAVALTVLSLLALGLIGSALTGIYTAAVYRYAVAGESNTFFSEQVIRDAFRRK